MIPFPVAYCHVLVVLLITHLLLLVLPRPAQGYTTTTAKRDLSSSRHFFHLSTGVAEYDHAYEVALRELGENRNLEEGVYVAGEGWGTLWTRDSAYAIELAAGLVDPDFSIRTMLKCTESITVSTPEKKNSSSSITLIPSLGGHFKANNDEKHHRNLTVWFQDRCEHFGGWPNLSDAIVGVQGAWTLYLVTGNKTFLETVYEYTVASLHRAELDAYDPETGLFTGCSSFMESNSAYPTRFEFNGELVSKTRALSTNLLHYNGYLLGSRMARELGEEQASATLQEGAKQLREAIRTRMWLENKGYYSYVMDENHALWEQMEGLGEAFALLAPDFENDPTRIRRIFQNIPRSARGLASLWPQFQQNFTTEVHPNEQIHNEYHNGRIWPFVQGYWAMAAAKHRFEDVFAEELQNLMKLSQAAPNKALSRKYKFDKVTTRIVIPKVPPEASTTDTFAEYYELDGSYLWTQRRQLWSDAAYLSFFYYGIFGLRLHPHGIEMQPMKPKRLFPDRPVNLRGVKYRGKTMDISVVGVGSYLVEGRWNEQVQELRLIAEGNYAHQSLFLSLEQLESREHHKIELFVSEPQDTDKSIANSNQGKGLKQAFSTLREEDDNTISSQDLLGHDSLPNPKISDAEFEKRLVSYGSTIGIIFLAALLVWQTKWFRTMTTTFRFRRNARKCQACR